MSLITTHRVVQIAKASMDSQVHRRFFVGPSGFVVGELQTTALEVDRCLEVVPPAIATSAPRPERRRETY